MVDVGLITYLASCSQLNQYLHEISSLYVMFQTVLDCLLDHVVTEASYSLGQSLDLQEVCTTGPHEEERVPQ